MIETWKKTELEKLTRAHGFRFSKSFGQNFLVDRNTLEKVVRGAELSPDNHVVEIGPGAGALTVLLAQAAGQVTAVEVDGRLMPLLREVTEGLQNVTLVHEDFLKYSKTLLSSAGPLSGGTYKLVGNLPYYITSPIIAGLFEPGADGIRPAPPALAVFMMQREVAERLLSPPGKKAYGAISVLVQYYADAELLFQVSREVFVPRPNVDSTVIRLRPKDLSGDDAKTVSRMFRLVRAGFDMRRKTLRNSLAGSGFPAAELEAAFVQSGIDPVRRAETLSPRDFYTLASHLS